jgi:hypothetical protein
MRILKFRLIKNNQIVSTQELKPNGIIDCPVEWDTACQFTGLLDKLGKEIYEGDIVSIKKGWSNLWEIKWHNYRHIARCIQSPMVSQNLYQVAKWRSLEVTGNIYENPELLKVRKS